MDSRIRYAVVGLGWFAQEAVLPAFRNASKNSRLAALVSGDPQKRATLGQEYGVPAVSYEEYDALLESGEIDAVFIALPNSQHADYTRRAADRNVHVLCEKPLAGTAAEAKQMVETCAACGVRLMTAYRLHFQEANLSVVELLKAGTIGDPRMFTATHTSDVEPANSRLRRDLAGGPLRDLGVYCINAARYLFQDEPVEAAALTASSDDPRFDEVPEMVGALLRFPGERLAAFTCGFGESAVSEYRVVGTAGDVRLESGFSFQFDMRRLVTREGSTEEKDFPRSDQVGPEITYFSGCLQQGIEPEPSGREGLIDLQIIEAIETSMRSGRAEPLSLPTRVNRPDGLQQIDRPPVAEPELVNAAPPK